MGSPEPGLAVPAALQRGAHGTRAEWIESARFAHDLLAETLARDNLAGIDLLDVGCGTKLVKTLLDRALPIGSYTGIDVAPEVIEWLQANVSDSRFEFHCLDAHNAMYNPGGSPLVSFDLLPMGPRQFDLISLFSVFTHLAPQDFVAMLEVLRRHARPNAKLLFSLFLEDPDHPSGLTNSLEEALAGDDPQIRERAEEAISRALPQDRRFVDEIPDQPLAIARYQKAYALELVDGTGWEVMAVRPPQRHIQHYLVCRPI